MPGVKDGTAKLCSITLYQTRDGFCVPAQYLFELTYEF